jgi:calcineurin-binding protein cabin-1
LLAQSEEVSASDKWPGFVLTKEGEEFEQQNTNLFKYDLLYNPLRFESWEKLGNIYDEEVDLLLNDGSKHINVVGWRKNSALSQRVETSRRRSRRCLLMSLALANSPDQQSEIHELLALVYYDSLQSVVPFYDQRSVLPSKDATWTRFCENSMKHFNKAFSHRYSLFFIQSVFYFGQLLMRLRIVFLKPSCTDKIGHMHSTWENSVRSLGTRMKFLYPIISKP